MWPKGGVWKGRKRDENKTGTDSAREDRCRVDLTQNLPTRQAVSLTLPTDIGDLGLADTYFQGTHLPRIGMSRRFDADWATQMDYDFRFSTLGLGISYRALKLSLRSDALSLNRARSFGLGIGAALEF